MTVSKDVHYYFKNWINNWIFTVDQLIRCERLIATSKNFIFRMSKSQYVATINVPKHQNYKHVSLRQTL